MVNPETQQAGTENAESIGRVFWGPAWMVGVLARLVALPDGSTIVECWGADGWSADGRVTIVELLRSGFPAKESQLKSLGLLPESAGMLTEVAAEA